MIQIILWGVLLAHQDLAISATPASRPVLVRPADTEWEIWFA
jgi:hypothetical protein